MRILLTRHAETKDNIRGIIQKFKGSEFTEEGLNQISKLVKRLEKEKIDLIVSSDFERCKITAEKISQKMHVPVEYTKLLREKNDGNWIGKNSKEVNWDSLQGTFETRKAPNGESLLEVRERGRNFFKQILEQYKNTNKTILVVSHATFLRVFIGDLIGLSLHDSIFKILIDNCSLTEIDFDKKHIEGCRLKLLNETKFLD